MAYTKQTWADLPSKTTPINATRLGHIEDGIFNAAATADNAASAAGTAVSQIGQVSSRVDTLTGRVNGLDTAVSNKVDKVADKGLSTNDYDNTDKDKVDSLGTASTKNSTSVVTSSSDLVESGAVFDAIESAYQLVEDTVGWSGKNKYSIKVGNDLVDNNGGGTHSTDNGSLIVNCTTGNYSGIYFTGDSQVRKFINSGVDCDAIFTIQSTVNTTVKIGNNTEIAVTTEPKRVRLNFTGTSNIFVVYGTGTSTTFTISDFMICDPDIIDDTYEPYHASVEESLAEKADNSVIGTVEGANASKAWSVGEHFINGGQFKEVTQAIASGGAINDSNTVDKPIADLLATTLLNLSKHTDVTILQNDSKKFGNIVSFRVQFQVTADIANKTDIITCSDIGHPHYGTCEVLESNLGNTVPILITNSSSSVLFNCRAAMPTGYYVLNYTFII